MSNEHENKKTGQLFNRDRLKQYFPVVLLSLLVIFALWKWGIYWFDTGPNLIGKEAPEIFYRTESGASGSVQDKNGTAVLLVFWASWCSNCLLEMPEIRMLENHYSNKGLTVLAFNVDESVNEVAGKFRAEEWPRNLIFKFDRTRLQNYGVQSLPMSVLINRKGIVTKAYIGSQDWLSHEMRFAVEDALNQ